MATVDRSERHLMRQRGAGARTVISNFGFSFDLGGSVSTANDPIPPPPPPHDILAPDPPAKRRKITEEEDHAVESTARKATATSTKEADVVEQEAGQTARKTKEVRKRFYVDEDVHENGSRQLQETLEEDSFVAETRRRTMKARMTKGAKSTTRKTIPMMEKETVEDAQVEADSGKRSTQVLAKMFTEPADLLNKEGRQGKTEQQDSPGSISESGKVKIKLQTHADDDRTTAKTNKKTSDTLLHRSIKGRGKRAKPQETDDLAISDRKEAGEIPDAGSQGPTATNGTEKKKIRKRAKASIKSIATRGGSNTGEEEDKNRSKAEPSAGDKIGKRQLTAQTFPKRMRSPLSSRDVNAGHRRRRQSSPRINSPKAARTNATKRARSRAAASQSPSSPPAQLHNHGVRTLHSNYASGADGAATTARTAASDASSAPPPSRRPSSGDDCAPATSGGNIRPAQLPTPSPQAGSPSPPFPRQTPSSSASLPRHDGGPGSAQAGPLPDLVPLPRSSGATAVASPMLRHNRETTATSTGHSHRRRSRLTSSNLASKIETAANLAVDAQQAGERADLDKDQGDKVQVVREDDDDLDWLLAPSTARPMPSLQKVPTAPAKQPGRGGGAGSGVAQARSIGRRARLVDADADADVDLDDLLTNIASFARDKQQSEQVPSPTESVRSTAVARAPKKSTKTKPARTSRA